MRGSTGLINPIESDFTTSTATEALLAVSCASLGWGEAQVIIRIVAKCDAAMGGSTRAGASVVICASCKSGSGGCDTMIVVVRGFRICLRPSP